MNDTDYIDEINRIRKEKNAIILAHYYQRGDIQDLADFTGDSLELSQKAEQNDAEIILFAGVKFMAETAKILAPGKKVLIPDLNAGCSLADSCKAEEFEKFIKDNHGRTVITYVNTTAEIKALSDISCTSSNAIQIVNSLPEDEKIIFAPDRNLGDHVINNSKKNILLWNGACHVHEEFSYEGILKIKEDNPHAKIIVHPECESEIREIADYIGSTKGLINFTREDDSVCYIVATDPGVIHQMKKYNPGKEYIPAPPKNPENSCSECNYMKLITLEKIYNCLKKEEPEIFLEENIIKAARKPIKRMMEISNKLNL